MEVEEFKKEILKQVNSTDMKDLDSEVSITYDGKQFLIRFPRIISEELELKKGDKCRLFIKREDIGKKKGVFTIIN